MYSGKIAVPPGGGGIGRLQIIFTVFKTQSTKGNFVTITKFTINIKNMFYHKFLIPALNQGKGMQLHEPRQPSQRQYWFPLLG
jgi:hypothetical protein